MTLRPRSLVLVPMVAGVAVYLPSLWGKFLWDDTNFLQRWILGGATVGDIFFPDPSVLGASYYHPFTSGFAFLLWKVFGKNPLGWHVANLLFHAGTAAGVFMLLRWFVWPRSGGDPAVDAGAERRAMLACTAGATVWACWPATSEAVAWISARGEQQMAFLVVWALVLHLRARDAGTTSLPAAFLFWGAILSKEVGVVFLPLAAAATVLLPPLPGAVSSGPRSWFASALWLPHGLAFVAYTGMRRWSLGGGSEGSLVRIALEKLQANAAEPTLRGWGFYVREALLMGSGSPYYEDPPPLDSVLVYAVLGVALLIAAALAVRRTAGRPWTMAAVWFVVCLGPPLAVVAEPISVTAVAMRYLYMPVAAIGFMVALLIARMPEAALTPRKVLPGLAVAVALLAIPVQARIAPWMSAESLWRRAVRDLPDRTLPHANLGLEHLDQFRFEEAERHLRIAAYTAKAQTEPQRHMAFCRLAEIYIFRRELALARTAMTKASTLAGSAEGTANALTIVSALDLLDGAETGDEPGEILVSRERLKRAAAGLEHAIALDKYDATSRLVLAMVNESLDELMRAKLLNEELAELALTNAPLKQKALASAESLGARIRAESDPFRARYFEAQELEHRGKFDEATDAYERALEAEPDRLEALVPLAAIEFRRRRMREAIAHAVRATELAPENASLWFNLGLYRYHGSDTAGAQEALETAVRLQPAWSKPHFHLARTLEVRGDLPGALRSYRAFLKFDGLRQTRGIAEHRIAAIEARLAAGETGAPEIVAGGADEADKKRPSP